ncbi:hypothetical protein L9F63_017561 [Diploptera punctata]|uniref:Uncharacterized protein n=1 Tax=Diploptera punctata TaxID=6984 RepID=A0AAD7ZZ86_DIPPU|nr:hypothetical protein L9F63_017561 [Diploptera punctata]
MPKEVFVSKKKLVIAVTSGIAEFNMGCQTTQKLKAAISGVQLSASGQNISAMRDKRFTNSEVSAKRVFKTARRRLKLTKTAIEAKKESSRGSHIWYWGVLSLPK